MSRIILTTLVLFGSATMVNAAHPHAIGPRAAKPPAAAHPHAHAGNPHSPKGSEFAKHHPRRDEVNDRVASQRSRIERGLKSGRLTPAQAKQLEANDRSIKKQEHADVRANGGYLTKAEQKQFNQEEHANSKLIRDDKDPAAYRAAGNPHSPQRSEFAKHHPRRDEVNDRLAEQRSRIEQGLRSGKLTPAQAKQLEANDRSIKQQERADVRANGGYLTKAEQKQFNQEEHANSKLIRDDKHPAAP